MRKNKNLYIYALIGFSGCMGIVHVLLGFQGKEVSASTESLWGIVFVLLTILWAYYDADDRNFDRPFDFGFLIYIFWPVAFPWYLIKTRGVEGVVLLFGFMALWLWPWVAGLVAYAYFYD